MKRRIVALLFALFLPVQVGAQTLEDYDYEDLALRGLGLEVGGVWAIDMAPALSYGVRADLGFAGPRVRITPVIRFWSSSLRDERVNEFASQIIAICARQRSSRCPASLDLGTVERSDLELSVDAHYLIPTGYIVEPYVGGGLGLHLLNGHGEFIDDTFVEDLLDTLAPGVNLLGGVNLSLGRHLQLVTEARFMLGTEVQYGGVVLGGTWALPVAASRTGGP